MKLCRRCGDEISNAADRFAIAGYGIYTEINYKDMEKHWVPESECEFWIHDIFNKVLKFMDWRVASKEERDAIFAKIKAEAPDQYKILVDAGAAPP
jgi:hypothetical protein